MKVLSLTEPYATIIKAGKKQSKHEVGKLITEASYIFMQVLLKFQKNTERIKI